MIRPCLSPHTRHSVPWALDRPSTDSLRASHPWPHCRRRRRPDKSGVFGPRGHISARNNWLRLKRFFRPLASEFPGSMVDVSAPDEGRRIVEVLLIKNRYQGVSRRLLQRLYSRGIQAPAKKRRHCLRRRLTDAYHAIGTSRRSTSYSWQSLRLLRSDKARRRFLDKSHGDRFAGADLFSIDHRRDLDAIDRFNMQRVCRLH